MASQARLLLLMIVIAKSDSIWSPNNCSNNCICHEMWIEALNTKLNALDCHGKEKTVGYTTIIS